MSRSTFALGAALVVALGFALRPHVQQMEAANTPDMDVTQLSAGVGEGLLHGRVLTVDGEMLEGRLRFGGDEEALWGNHFNGHRPGNVWMDYAPSEERPRERLSWSVFGLEFAVRARPDGGRPFMARFGDITRIEARGRDLRVTLKSGTVFHLDRYAADDFADGVRVWDDVRGIVDLPESKVRSIEFFSPPAAASGPEPLYGTVSTSRGEFTGLIQWDREACLALDRLVGRSVRGEEVNLRFDAIRSIARLAGDEAAVTLLDGRRIVLAHTREDGRPNRGMYVDDERYGRVLISWDAFEQVDFSAGASGPVYEEFRPGRSLNGTVTTRSGQQLSGRLVYDLDESETTETLDAPAHGVNYTIPFELISGIEPLSAAYAHGARVTLHDGEELLLERAGDLARSNAGILVFPGAGDNAKYVAWDDVATVEFDELPM